MNKKRLFFRSWWKYQTYQNNPNRKSLTTPPPAYVGIQTSILQDVDYRLLTREQRGDLHGMMILAAFDAGHIDADPKRLAVALGVDSIDDMGVFGEWLVPCSGDCVHTPSERRPDAVQTPSQRRPNVVSTREEKGREEKRSTAVGKKRRPRSIQQEKLPGQEDHFTIDRNWAIDTYREIRRVTPVWAASSNKRQFADLKKAHKAAKDGFRPAWTAFCEDLQSFEGKSGQPSKFLEYLDKYQPKEPTEEDRKLDELCARFERGEKI